MIHLYLSLGPGDIDDHGIVSEILALNAGIGLVQAAGGDDEITRGVADAHIAACEGLMAVVSGAPSDNQLREIRSADAAGVPVWVLSDGAMVDIVEDHPVRSFDPASFLGFVSRLVSESPAK